MRNTIPPSGTKRSTLLTIILVVMVVSVVFISFTYENLSTKTYKLPLTSSGEISNISRTFFEHYLHYNFEAGYVNFTDQNINASYFYYISPFNGIKTVELQFNNSSGAVAQNMLQLFVYQASLAGNTSGSSTPFTLSGLTLSTPQDKGLASLIKPFIFSVSGNFLGIDLEPYGVRDAINMALTPGFYDFYLNFTITPYSSFGPYKFPSQSETVHLEYNNTIVEW